MATVIKYYCDKCGKEIDKKYYGVTYTYYDENICEDYTESKDLCESCSIELHRYLNNVPEWI